MRRVSIEGQSRALLFGYDPRAPCWFVCARALLLLGYADQALETARQIILMMHQLSHRYSSAVGLNWAATFYRMQRDKSSTRERADGLIKLCGEQGFTIV